MEGSRGRSYDLLIAGGLVCAVLLAYWGVLKNGFVNFDDRVYLTENAVTQRGISASTVAWAFTTRTAENWHPLTWLSMMLDVELFGLDPSGHHAMSLGLHGLNTALVFSFTRRLGIARGPSAIAAGLFGLHPLHVESVAWAAERKDVLSMAFGLLMLLAYTRYTEAPSKRGMVGVTALLVLGLMAKPMLVTIPFVLLLLDWWPLGRVASPAWIASPKLGGGETTRVSRERLNGRRLLLEKAPLFAVALLSCAVTYVVQKDYGVQDIALRFRFENAAYSYVAYLKQFIFPARLACFYPMIDLGMARTALSIATLATFTAIAWRLRATRPYVLMGWLWFLGTLVPMIGLVQVGRQAHADRYMYFPSLGLGFIASLGLSDAVSRVHLPRPARILAYGTLLGSLGVATWRQTSFWHDSVALFEHTVLVTERNWFVRLGLATEFIDDYQFERAEAMLRRSLTDGAPPGHVLELLSVIYSREHRTEEALRAIDQALRAEPTNSHMLINRGMYLSNVGRDAEAIADLERGIALYPGGDPKHLDEGRRTLALCRQRLGGEGGRESGAAVPR
jgi:tetratricopeptide (TPR) repeat protein